MSYALLKNKDGVFVAPTIETFKSAAANADWKSAPGYYMVLVDQPGKDSWPITGASFILIHKDQPDAAKVAAMLKFFDWCYKHGADIAKSLDYVPIPANVVDLVEKTWSNEVKTMGNNVWP
jgi:phosphate transport system substrate-binding protein